MSDQDEANTSRIYQQTPTASQLDYDEEAATDNLTQIEQRYGNTNESGSAAVSLNRRRLGRQLRKQMQNLVGTATRKGVRRRKGTQPECCDSADEEEDPDGDGSDLLAVDDSVPSALRGGSGLSPDSAGEVRFKESRNMEDNGVMQEQPASPTKSLGRRTTRRASAVYGNRISIALHDLNEKSTENDIPFLSEMKNIMESDDDEDESGEMDQSTVEVDRHPSLVSDLDSSHYEREELLTNSSDGPDYGYGATVTDTEDNRGARDTRHRGSVQSSITARPMTTARRKLKRMLRQCRDNCRPSNIATWFFRTILCSYFVLVGIPLLLTSRICFYYLKDFHLLPGPAPMSWWLDFAGRQVVTLELARLTQWIFMDAFVLTQFSVRIIHAAGVFYFIQASGWPFLIVVWSLWDLLFLEGLPSHKFKVDWFNSPGWSIYDDPADPFVVAFVSVYLRILLALIILGFAAGIKRTLVSFHFESRQLREFRRKLRRLLKEAFLITVIGTLAKEGLEDDEGVFDTSRNLQIGKMGMLYFPTEPNEGTESEGEGEELDPSFTMRTMRPSVEKNKSNLRGGIMMTKSQGEKLVLAGAIDDWEEPISEDNSDISIHDVLKFRRLLAVIDDTHPFGLDFGAAGSRDECIESSRKVYNKLLEITPDSSYLPYETLRIATLNSKGAVDKAKWNALKAIFRPDARDEISLTKFVQSVDSVYKRLRYFRATIRNSSVIDRVLEGIINSLFYFVTALFLLSFMHYNPWPVLLSLTSLLVSISFALGSSVSKIVEGITLIAVSRPFDLGDRVYFVTPGARTINDPLHSWFVEDITVFSTSLRNAMTNEVSSIHNWSLSNMRIVNCNRSPNALVAFKFTTDISILEDEGEEELKRAFEMYVRQFPDRWQSLEFFGAHEIDSSNKYVVFSAAFKHYDTWQNASRIMRHRGEMLKFAASKVKDLDAVYPGAMSRHWLAGSDVEFPAPTATQAAC